MILLERVNDLTKYLLRQLFKIMKYLSLIYFLIIGFISCKPADPNYRLKPLQNTEYTGFISRNFFQAVVEVPLTKDELTILEERKSCFQEAVRKRDGIVIPILKHVAMEDKWNEMERDSELMRESDKEKLKKSEGKAKEENSLNVSDEKGGIFDKKEATLNSKGNPLINRGEFAWFLDSMFLYKEDYSDPEKCSFVFRTIQDGLFAKVEKTKLSFVGEDKISPFRNQKNQTNPNSSTSGSTSPLNTGIPQTVR